MALSYFYSEAVMEEGKNVVLDEDTSKHITQVLRMKAGEEVLLTNGKGTTARAVISDDHRKRCIVDIVSVKFEEQASIRVSIAISIIKNASRFEWFLEKATEIGVQEIIPLLCERTEKEKFRYDRMKNILISAMLQSQQCWMPVLREPTDFASVVRSVNTYHQKFIAHCIDAEKRPLSSETKNHSPRRLILIGPEGDFTPSEVQMALEHHFVPVSLGSTRLRTETAGIVAAALLANL